MPGLSGKESGPKHYWYTADRVRTSTNMEAPDHSPRDGCGGGERNTQFMARYVSQCLTHQDWKVKVNLWHGVLSIQFSCDVHFVNILQTLITDSFFLYLFSATCPRSFFLWHAFDIFLFTVHFLWFTLHRACLWFLVASLLCMRALQINTEEFTWCLLLQR